ncbi:MAG: fimbrillin family protein [Bacteroidales bacterium]|nr:fimbrillin family protein [Bacteroidales bacterium]
MFYSTKNILFTLSCLWLLTSCTDEATVNDTVVADKTPIALSVGGADTVSILKRAITKDDEAHRGQLPEGTALFMVIKSEKAEATEATPPLYTFTKGVTEKPDGEKVNRVSFGDGFVRYWDDCYARDAKLSIYAVCTPGRQSTAGDIIIGNDNDNDISYSHTAVPTTGAWTKDAPAHVVNNWKVSENQTATTLSNEDLCYSNNIANNADPADPADPGDGRLKFNNTLTNKFDHGRLAFYHALSKITFYLKRGKGFSKEEFKFFAGESIRLKNVYTQNETFDIATGEFTGAYTEGDIESMAVTKKTFEDGSDGYILEALVMPTTDLSGTMKGEVDVTIAHNHYQLSKADLLEKINEKDKTDYLDADGKRLKPGVNYIFTLTIGKTGVDNITATVLEWETVNAEELKPSNAKVTLTLEDRLGTPTNAYIYRLAETAENITGDITETGKGYVWTGPYEERNRLMGSPQKLQTDWYWPDNKTFYHLRAIAPMDDQTTKATAADGRDYVALEHGETYTDITWGAPFTKLTNGKTLAYTTDHGFDAYDVDNTHRIHPAIGATNSEIKLLMFHAMSDITFEIYTSGDSDPDRVDLGNGTDDNHTTIVLKNIATAGKVFLGNGKVEEDGSRSDFPFTALPTLNDEGHWEWAHYGAVPQALDDVQLVITTPDHNQYTVAMKDVVATSAISETNVRYPAYTDNKVNRWYPGVKYTYRFKLTKTGVTVTATIADWETVTADTPIWM